MSNLSTNTATLPEVDPNSQPPQSTTTNPDLQNLPTGVEDNITTTPTNPEPTPNPFPLLRLPPELRNRIYEFALGHTTYLVTTSSHCRRCNPPPPPPTYLALLATCRQIHAETRDLPFLHHHFDVIMPDDNPRLATHRTLVAFAAAFSARQRACLRNLVIPSWRVGLVDRDGGIVLGRTRMPLSDVFPAADMCDAGSLDEEAYQEGDMYTLKLGRGQGTQKTTGKRTACGV